MLATMLSAMVTATAAGGTGAGATTGTLATLRIGGYIVFAMPATTATPTGRTVPPAPTTTARMATSRVGG